MPRPDFIPRRDSAFAAWARQFTLTLSLDPVAFGLDSADAAALGVLMDSFDSALQSAGEPSTRTRPAISAKTAARAALARRLRELARRINAYPPVSDAQRLQLGLTPRSAAPAPSGRPQTRPVLNVRAVSGNRVELLLRDDSQPHHRGKPPGAIGAVLYVKIGAAAPTDNEAGQYAGLVTTATHTVQLPPAAVRQDVWITARWFNLRGEEGPWAQAARTMGVS